MTVGESNFSPVSVKNPNENFSFKEPASEDFFAPRFLMTASTEQPLLRAAFRSFRSLSRNINFVVVTPSFLVADIFSETTFDGANSKETFSEQAERRITTERTNDEKTFFANIN